MTLYNDNDIDKNTASKGTHNIKFIRHKVFIFSLVGILLFIVIGFGSYYLTYQSKANTLTLPTDVVSKVNFPLYVPSKLPSGYTYQQDSAHVRTGILFYKLTSGNKTITITEQIAPSVAINLTKIPSFTLLDVPAGKAAIGISVGNPAVIIITNTTMVNINSTKDTPKNVVSDIAKNIVLLKDTSSTR